MKEKIKQLEKENEMLKEIVDLQRKLLAINENPIYIKTYPQPYYPYIPFTPYVISYVISGGSSLTNSAESTSGTLTFKQGESICSASLNS